MHVNIEINITSPLIMYTHVLCYVKSPRVQYFAFDGVARLFRTRGAHDYNGRVCTHVGIACACTDETRVDEKVKAKGER